MPKGSDTPRPPRPQPSTPRSFYDSLITALLSIASGIASGLCVVTLADLPADGNQWLPAMWVGLLVVGPLALCVAALEYIMRRS